MKDKALHSSISFLRGIYSFQHSPSTAQVERALVIVQSVNEVSRNVCKSAHVGFGLEPSLASTFFVKVPELFDTVFLVLKKKPVIFLHWHHHITVLLCRWNSYVTESAAAIYFVAMNYSVHAVMYFYFFMAIVPYKWFPLFS